MGTESTEETPGRQQFTQMLGVDGIKKMSDDQLDRAKQEDIIASQQKKAAIRKRITEITEELKRVRMEDEREKREKEELKEQEKKSKELEKIKREKKKKEILPPSVSRFLGTREKGKFVVG